MNLWQKITSKIDTPSWLEWLLGTVFLFRIPSFFEPYWYGDETIYLTLGNGIRQGLTLYKDLHDNKPPLLYLLAALAGNIFWFKVILAFWSLVTIYFFWKLVNFLFAKNIKLQKIAVWSFAILTTIPLLEGNIANAELFFIGPTIAAFWILLAKNTDPNLTSGRKNLFLSGLLFSLAALFKIPAAFDLPAILIFWLITKPFNSKNLLETAKQFSIVIIGFLLPIGLTFVWYFFRGALPEYFRAVFLQNVGYLSSFRPGDIQKPFLIKNLPLIIRGLIVIFGFVSLRLARRKLSRQFIFTVAWLLMTLFAVTLSERPYPHYLLQSVASISLLIAMFVTSKTMNQLYTIIPLTLVVAIPVIYHFYVYAPVGYYTRFISFATKTTSKQDYYNSFNKDTARNYKIAEFVITSTKPTDRIFVWEDSANIYALTKRLPPIKYVAGYHIVDFSTPREIVEKINNTKPKLVIILPSSKRFPQLEGFLSGNYFLVSTIDGAKIWHVITTK